MTFTVSPWVVWAGTCLALFGACFVAVVAWRAARDAAGQVRYWLRDRVIPLLEDDRIVAGKCEACWAENNGEGCDWAMCGCACHDDEGLEELPPEQTWEQMTSHQFPLVGTIVYDTQKPDFWTPQNQALLHPERERRAPWWEAEHRAAYESLGFDYPSGLMARVRELAP